METFRSVVGHKKVIAYLQECVRSGHVSHAYLLDGPDGVGKRLVARLFAATLLCREGGTEPCGACLSCRQMDSGNQPDVSYVTHEKSVISVGDIREQLCNIVPVKPMVGPFRIFIVDEAERMNAEAQNALLKTLEEPPSYAVILLLTNNAEALLPTIRSRSVDAAGAGGRAGRMADGAGEAARLPRETRGGLRRRKPRPGACVCEIRGVCEAARRGVVDDEGGAYDAGGPHVAACEGVCGGEGDAGDDFGAVACVASRCDGV